MIFKSTKPKLKHYNIPPTDENHELLRKAKAAIAASHPDQALELLSTLKLKTLDIEITALSARLADLERTQRFGTESYDTETREHNKINKSIIFLITALEKEIAQSFEFYDKIRAALKSRYETRLSQKLSNRQPVNLRLVPSTAGTTPQAANTFVQYSEGQIRGKLAEYYQDAHGRLLLVGVPGAGKTTLLLQLELELLEKETTRIPVILNLTRWSSTFPTLEAWIQEILPSEMGLTINKKMAADLIVQNRLILFLDGLDEVKAEDRQACLEAIGTYGEDSSRYFILSSRIDEYQGVAKDAPVNGQVEVGTLTYEQLVEQLEKTEQNEGSKRLLAALKEDELLREIAEIPFYFNTLQLLFARGKYLHEFNFSVQEIEGRKKEIERNFVFEMFRKINNQGYDAQPAFKYLGFFASRLKRVNLVDFELTHVQYNWYTLSKWDFIIGCFIKGVVEGIVYGVVLGLSLSLFAIICMIILLYLLDGAVEGVSPRISLILVLSMVLSMIIIVGSIVSYALGYGMLFSLTQIIKCSYYSAIDKLKNIKKVGIGTIIQSNLYLSRSKSLKTKGYPTINTRESIKWNWAKTIRRKNVFSGFVFCLTLGLFIGLATKHSVGVFIFFIVFMFYILIEDFSKGVLNQLHNNHYSFIQINKPYQRFIASAKMFYFSILQHFHIYKLIYKKGLLPKKLVPFLNDMVECNILETTGASWRFRHRILQDYFADQWVETEFEPEQK